MTKEQFIENYLDKYEREHPDERIDYEALREQADCEWYDNEVDHGTATEYALTPEQEAVSKDLRKGRAVDAYGKERKRERKANPDKQDIMSALYDGLLSYLTDENRKAIDHVDMTNPERQLDFNWKGVSYSVTLTAHRPKKG
jgi:hypothetical protein